MIWVNFDLTKVTRSRKICQNYRFSQFLPKMLKKYQFFNCCCHLILAQLVGAVVVVVVVLLNPLQMVPTN